MSNGRIVQNLVVDQLLQREAHLHRSIIPTLILLNFPSTRWTLSQQCSSSLWFICLWYKALLHMNRVFQLYRLDQVAKSKLFIISIIHAFNIKLCSTQSSFANTNCIKLQNPKLFIISIIDAFNIKLCYTQSSFANTNCTKLQNPNLYKNKKNLNMITFKTNS